MKVIYSFALALLVSPAWALVEDSTDDHDDVEGEAADHVALRRNQAKHPSQVAQPTSQASPEQANGEVDQFLDPTSCLHSCTRYTPCGRCQGLCDEDEDCTSPHLCQIHTYPGDIPGCTGEGVYGSGYCYHPADKKNYPPAPQYAQIGCSAVWPCNKCEGFCYSSRDCASGICRRPPIAGCAGTYVPPSMFSWHGYCE